MSEAVIKKLKKIIAEELDVNLTADEIDENASLFEDGLGLDSIVIVELIALAEERFGFLLSEDELNPESFTSLRVFADVIASKSSDGRDLTITC
ncbi:Acyl carrier protein [Candidatus Desulfarcum epimagneticum]|uniref:Acyl carrier protein n=1 Tax=uncultured Desulfobacteraceae bacterium TaxID=218296 RepID=A0A484HD77_9BACT|nr:Acyl carrier protein [uncultured Desulfobacteraceae bacterium]